MKAPKFLWPFLRAFAKSTIVLIPLSFVFSSTALVPSLHSLLKIRIDPAFSGGQRLVSFKDPLGDDRGDGKLSYPLHELYSNNNVTDIISYAVYRPMIGASWAKPRDFWQLSLSFAELANPFASASGFSGTIATIYVDVDGARGGSVETASERAEYVSFPEEYPWDFMVRVSGDSPGEAEFRTSSGASRRIPCIVSKKASTVYVQVPLDFAEVKPVLDGRPTRHWVFCGLADPLGAGGFMGVRELASLRSGGGAAFANTPRVYDTLVPEGYSQAEVLAAAGEGKTVVVPPLVVPGFNPLSDFRDRQPAIVLNVSKDKIAMYAEAEAAEKVAAASDKKLSLERDLQSADKGERALALFSLGRNDEALALFNEMLSQDPGDITARAYKGSLIAMKAGAGGNPAQAVTLVKEAYEWLDTAVEEAERTMKSTGENAWTDKQLVNSYLSALMNRANVSSSVPEAVFGKGTVAAEDFINAAKGFSKFGQLDMAATCFLKAGISLDGLGRKEEARVQYLRAASIPDRPASVSLELAKRGYID